MKWLKLGAEVPTENEHGDRPETDSDGNPRETEFVAYDDNDLDKLEFELVEVTVRQRRHLSYQVENLLKGKQLSIVHAADVESFFAGIIKTFVRGIRHVETGVELREKEMISFFDDEFEAEDYYALLATIRMESDAHKAKKKSWSSRFGSPTSLSGPAS